MSKIQIDILIEDDEFYGARYWEYVPRIGETIKLCGDKAGWYLIKYVEWQGDDYPIAVLTVIKHSENEINPPNTP